MRTTSDVVASIVVGTQKKGDVLAAARLAAIMAVKKTPDLIPLFHPIAIGGVEADIKPSGERVEMEALTAAAAAGLTVIDMVKGSDPDASIDDVRVLTKTGGKTGDWARTR